MPRLAVRDYNNSVVHTETSSSGIQTTTAYDIEAADWTISLWCKYIAPTSTDTIIHIDGGAGSDRDVLFVQSATDTIRTNAGGSSVAFTGGSLTGIRNKWSHFALTYDQSITELSLYVDGSLWESKTLTVAAADGAFFLGGRTTGSLPMGGFITNFLFFTEHFDATKVSNLHYNNAYDTANLDTELLFSEGSGTSIADTSGNGNNASITGGLAWSTHQPFSARSAISEARVALS